MPTPKFISSNAELHMGIFQERLERLKGRMRSITMKLTMVSEKPANSSAGVDLTPEQKQEAQINLDKQRAEYEAEFKRLDAEYKIIEGNLIDYENKVLLLTELE
jgi:hypothetical protein